MESLKDLAVSGDGRRKTKHVISLLHTIPKMNLPAYSVDWTKEMRFNLLKNLPLQWVDASSIKVIIGVCAYFLQAALEKRLGPPGTPIAVRTRLGWTAFSHLPGSEEYNIHVCRIEAKLQFQNDS